MSCLAFLGTSEAPSGAFRRLDASHVSLTHAQCAHVYHYCLKQNTDWAGLPCLFILSDV